MAEDDSRLLSANAIVALQDQRTRAWHLAGAGQGESRAQKGDAPAQDVASEGAREWLALVESQHRANFDLWHIEDEARAPDATDSDLAAVKRRIDKTNQLRNDLVEELDGALLKWLGERGLPNEGAPLNSESPGLIIDRLSILSLKIHHTREEAERAGAPEGHAERNRRRLRILDEQRGNLAGCLDALWGETLNGIRRFKLYRQMKMYNDPALNPAIYRRRPPE